MNPTTPTSALFVGWHRPHSRSPWQPVCHGPSAEIVLVRLLDAVKGGDKTVLRDGIDPNDHPATMRRRRF